MARPGLVVFGALTVLNPTFVPQVTTFLRFALALRGLAVLVHFLFDEPCTFLDLALDAHVGLLSAFATAIRVRGTNAARADLILRRRQK
jgi:hypothetical protein